MNDFTKIGHDAFEFIHSQAPDPVDVLSIVTAMHAALLHAFMEEMGESEKSAYFKSSVNFLEKMVEGRFNLKKDKK